MKLVIVFLLTVLSLSAQLPRNIQAGKLACAARMTSVLQVWCFKGTILSYNAVQDMGTERSNILFSFEERTIGERDARVTWMFMRKAGAISWQAVTSIGLDIRTEKDVVMAGKEGPLLVGVL